LQLIILILARNKNQEIIFFEETRYVGCVSHRAAGPAKELHRDELSLHPVVS